MKTSGGKNADVEFEIQQLLNAIDQGEDGALEQLVSVMYPQLKQLAHFQLLNERPDHTLNTTAIVHEAYLRMAKSNSQWADRAHFLRASALVIRHLLVDSARKFRSDKRGNGISPEPFTDHHHANEDDNLAVLALDAALKVIAEIDPRLVRIIECRYFLGLSVDDTAEALGVSARTVARDWNRARGYLLKTIKPG